MISQDTIIKLVGIALSERTHTLYRKTISKENLYAIKKEYLDPSRKINSPLDSVLVDGVKNKQLYFLDIVAAIADYFENRDAVERETVSNMLSECRPPEIEDPFGYYRKHRFCPTCACEESYAPLFSTDIRKAREIQREQRVELWKLDGRHP